ncbi:hypothetical protein EYZ11_003501 [Aspergillus tanneri]|nr:hypothetical protein EYZ11_003501 [Aspergillus tanneri]
MLKDIEPDSYSDDQAMVSKHVKSFRPSYRPGHKLPVHEWNELRRSLLSSFYTMQLKHYARDWILQKEREVQEHGNDMVTPWKPGISPFLDTGNTLVADRIARMHEDIKGKKLYAERILRDCWQLGILNETGQIYYRLSAPVLSLLLSSANFSFEELASLHDAKIDVTHSLRLVVISGSQKACESIRDIIHDTTTRIRQESVELYSPSGIKAKETGCVLKQSFLSWVSKTYGVAFEIHKSEPSKILYLAENKQGADNARRTLNLAMHDSTAPRVPFSTYLSASEPVSYYAVDTERNTTWRDRERPWVRWAATSSQATVAKIMETPFFNKHETRLSDGLLKLLRAKSSPDADQHRSAKVQESIIAKVGRCLFLHKTSLTDKSISAMQLGKLSLPRAFTTDVPRVTSFLRSLTPRALDDESMYTHRIRLVPSFRYADAFPELNVEVTTQKTHAASGSSIELSLQSAKAVLTESNVDYLLPENGLDLRFTRKLTRELLEAPQEDSLLRDLRDTLQVFSKARMHREDMPLPPFFQISLPNEFLRNGNGTHDPNGHTTGEYMSLPINDIQGTRIHRYDFRGYQLNYSSYETGPYYPNRTTDCFLDMDMSENSQLYPDSSSAPSDLSNGTSRDFNSFYTTACELAIELDKAWRTM